MLSFFSDVKFPNMTTNWTSFEDTNRHGIFNNHITPTCRGETAMSMTRSSSSYSTPWRLTDEQKAYYIKHFGLLQSDYQSSISGDLAREFFTKSGLPIRELSHIWELSDLDRDGTLNLVEFCISFHLVVLRKKTYQLPKNWNG